MKKGARRLLVLLLSLAVVMGLSATALAAGTVTYEGQANRFVFAPGSRLSPTDLFTDLKNVMPGDRLTQKITVKNDASNGVKVKLYVRSKGAQAGSEAFLSQLRLTVSKSSGNEMPQMFDAAADQTAGMTAWVLLGTLYSGGKVDLDVTLEVPLEMGNEFQAAVGYIDWEFKVEELPIEADDPTPPKTGDPVLLTAAKAMTVVSLGGLFLLSLGKYRKKGKK